MTPSSVEVDDAGGLYYKIVLGVNFFLEKFATGHCYFLSFAKTHRSIVFLLTTIAIL
jgi:hypothetical protein